MKRRVLIGIAACTTTCTAHAGLVLPLKTLYKYHELIFLFLIIPPLSRACIDMATMTLPNKGPYDPEFENLPTPEEGMAYSAFPFDQKYMDDMGWYDQMGRSLIEQRKVFTRPRSGEEQVEMVKKALEDAEIKAREMEEEGDVEVDDDEINERQNKRLWSVCLEAVIKGSGAVMQYLVREKGLNAKTAPERIDQMVVELQIASYHGHVDVVKVLVQEADADINHEDDRQTPLSRAAMGGHPDLVKWLLENGASYSISESAQNSVFSSAAAGGNVEVMNILLAVTREREPQKPTSAFLKSGVLGCAAQSASVEMLKLVLEQGGYGQAADNTEQQRKDAILAIPICIRNDNTNWTCLDTVIDCAIPRDSSGNFVKTDDEFFVDNISAAIGNSAARLKPMELNKLLQLVLDATSLTRGSPRFKRILHESIHRCYDPKTEPCARDLLEKWGADPNVNDADDKRDPYPLPLVPGAVSRGEVEWVRFWLDHGADIHRAHGRYCNGQTALALAVSRRQGETEAIVRELLSRGGPIDKMDDDLVGKTQLNVVAYGSELNSVELTCASVAEGNEDSERRETVTLEFADGITKAWLKNIQYRRPDAELAQDGTGRPRKGRHT